MGLPFSNVPTSTKVANNKWGQFLYHQTMLSAVTKRLIDNTAAKQSGTTLATSLLSGLGVTQGARSHNKIPDVAKHLEKYSPATILPVFWRSLSRSVKPTTSQTSPNAPRLLGSAWGTRVGHSTLVFMQQSGQISAT